MDMGHNQAKSVLGGDPGTWEVAPGKIMVGGDTAGVISQLKVNAEALEYLYSELRSLEERLQFVLTATRDNVSLKEPGEADRDAGDSPTFTELVIHRGKIDRAIRLVQDVRERVQQ